MLGTWLTVIRVQEGQGQPEPFLTMVPHRAELATETTDDPTGGRAYASHTHHTPTKDRTGFRSLLLEVSFSGLGLSKGLTAL